MVGFSSDAFIKNGIELIQTSLRLIPRSPLQGSKTDRTCLSLDLSQNRAI
jgi:hypothetical protein